MSKKKRKLRQHEQVPVQIHNPKTELVLNRAIIGMAIAGLAVSGYLAYLQFSSANAAFCAEGSGCDIVRDSIHSRLFGVPIALLGVLGYAAILAISLWPLKATSKRLPLLLMGLAGFIFSAYLTYLELAVIKAVCPYCIVSAVLITGILVASLLQKPLAPGLSNKRVALFAGIVVVLVLIVPILSQRPTAQNSAQTDFQTRLAKHLTDQGAVLYGAYWCPHCNNQKEIFGKASSLVNYVECDARGQNPNVQLCKDKGIKLYPTWEIKGMRYEGVIALDELAKLSGFVR